MANFEKIATVLDLCAELIEQTEREKQAAQAVQLETRLNKIAATHVQAHGEALPDEARQKLAKTDGATLDLIEDLLQKQAGTVDAMGGPATAEPVIARTTKEAASAADDQFLNWIISQ